MAHNLPVVVIVLSTFNGERFLWEQLNSLYCQTYGNIEIIVRDDGSKDGTCEILKRFSRERNNMNVLFERNIGVVSSFLRLLDLVPPSAQYVALCDQDDVWREDKIEIAISFFRTVEPTTPAMYCGALEVVDENLNRIGAIKKAIREPSLENALVQNVATGCTTVINKSALRLVTGKKVAINKIQMHDWWLYQIISAFGLILFDDIPKIRYRQHSRNVIGSSSGIELWVKRIKRHLWDHDRSIRCQAKELLRVYGPDMSEPNYKLVSEFLERTQVDSFGKRISYAIRTPVYRQSFLDNIVLRALIILGRI